MGYSLIDNKDRKKKALSTLIDQLVSEPLTRDERKEVEDICRRLITSDANEEVELSQVA